MPCLLILLLTFVALTERQLRGPCTYSLSRNQVASQATGVEPCKSSSFRRRLEDWMLVALWPVDVQDALLEELGESNYRVDFWRKKVKEFQAKHTDGNLVSIVKKKSKSIVKDDNDDSKSIVEDDNNVVDDVD
jgi:hypothetical protein